ncbi:MAG: hypothetical protein M3Z27_09140 [Actinomycetota bacterium]|nr:hypothetical protein [Actinomycetota bacterium]
MTASPARARESAHEARALAARAAEALNSERFVVAPASGWTDPEPIARQRLGKLGAVLFAVRKDRGGNAALYGLYQDDPQVGGWLEVSLSGAAWFEDGFSQPPYAPGLPLVELVAVASHSEDGADLIRMVPGQVVQGVSALRIVDDEHETPVEISSLGAFIALHASRTGLPAPRLIARHGGRDSALELRN